MKTFGRFVMGSFIAGALVIVPIYLATLLLLKGIKSSAGLVKPVARLLPDWLPGEQLLAVLFVVVLCLVVGMLIRTPAGRAVAERMERSLFERIPGYSLLRSLTQRIVGSSTEEAWRPALVEIEEALVPAFIIEELDDGRYTVFVPSIPTPLAGAVYVLEGRRVHPVDVPFTQAIKVVSRWGHGSSLMIAAMAKTPTPAAKPERNSSPQ